mgnify:FL=1
MENRKLISLYTLSDPETGEVIREYNKMLNPPKYIRFPKDFTKIHWRAGNSMNNIDLGYFVKLTDYLEYSTNKLVYRHVGRTPKPLLHKDMADILDVSKRTVTTFMGKMSDIKSILRIDSHYYVNPSFASRSAGLDSGIVMRMIDIDPTIFNHIDQKQQSIIKNFNLLP